MIQQGLFGIPIDTDLDISVSPAPVSSARSVRIATDAVSRPASVPVFQNRLYRIYRQAPGTAVLELAAGRIVVSADQIVVDLDDLAEVDSPLRFAWPLPLSLRGREGLHGSVVERGGAGVGILGPSGAGKSTAALALVELGFRLVADDLIVFDEALHVEIGPPYLRIRADQARGVEQAEDRYGKIRYRVPVSDAPVRLNRIVILDDSLGRLAALSGVKAVELLIRNLANGHVLFPNQGINRYMLATTVAREIACFGARTRSLQTEDLEKLAVQV